MTSVGIGYLLGLFGIVAFGAIVPVVPTGAAVSVAAVLATSDNLVLLPVVVAVGAAGAYVGDLVTYAALRLTGDGLARRVRWLRDEARADALARFRQAIEHHELRTLLLSRLVPGGRVPVLLGAALGGYSFRRYMPAALAAAALWSAVYAAIGLAGRSIFPEPWQGVLAAIGLVGLVGVAPPLWRRVSARRAGPASR